MCDPVTLTMTVAAGASLASAGLGAYGAIQQGNFQKALAYQNAQVANQAAADALNRGADEAGQTAMKGSLMGGRQETQLAAAGVDPSAGSAANIMADTRLMNEVDVARISNNAAREA